MPANITSPADQKAKVIPFDNRTELSSYKNSFCTDLSRLYQKGTIVTKDTKGTLTCQAQARSTMTKVCSERLHKDSWVQRKRRAKYPVEPRKKQKTKRNQKQKKNKMSKKNFKVIQFIHSFKFIFKSNPKKQKNKSYLNFTHSLQIFF